MLKTLTGYLNTFANTGFGCLECSPEELPGHGRTCRGSRALNPAGSSGNRAWSSAPSAAGTGALLDPAAASFCTAPTPNGQWSRKAAAGAVLGVWQRPQNPLGGFCTPGLQGATAAFAWQHRGPRGCAHPSPARSPQCPSLSPGRSFCLCPLLSWHSSAALGPPVPTAPGKLHPAAPKAPLPPGDWAVLRSQNVLDLPKEQLGNAQSKPVAGTAESLLRNTGSSHSSHLQPGHLCHCPQLGPSEPATLLHYHRQNGLTDKILSPTPLVFSIFLNFHSSVSNCLLQRPVLTQIHMFLNM